MNTLKRTSPKKQCKTYGKSIKTYRDVQHPFAEIPQKTNGKRTQIKDTLRKTSEHLWKTYECHFEGLPWTTYRNPKNI